MPKTHTHLHFNPTEVLTFTQCEHSPDTRSINIGVVGEYGGVSVFVSLSQAQQIAEYFAGLCAEWELAGRADNSAAPIIEEAPDLEIDYPEVDPRDEEERIFDEAVDRAPDTLANLGMCEADFR